MVREQMVLADFIKSRVQKNKDQLHEAGPSTLIDITPDDSLQSLKDIRKKE